MVILITGASHTGKTLLAQRMLEKYNFPYLSIDHLKMGLIRSGNTPLTPEDDEALTDYLWPIVREMIKTAIENHQHLVVEGAYVPYNWRESFDEQYLSSIRFICLAMTDEFIENHYVEIKEHSSDIENRLDDSNCTIASLKADNKDYINGFKAAGEMVFLINSDYEQMIQTILDDTIGNNDLKRNAMETEVKLIRLIEERVIEFKNEMQEAFERGFQGHVRDDGDDGENQWQVLPDGDFYQAMRAEGAEAYEAVDADGQRVGGAIINIDGAKRHGELSFLYVKSSAQSKGIGQAIWKTIEAMHPEVEVWETCTPYFDRRNIHFYINCCGFHAIEFFNTHHRDPNMPEQFDPSDGLFVFEKRMK